MKNVEILAPKKKVKILSLLCLVQDRKFDFYAFLL
jgi:hypothetical protein